MLFTEASFAIIDWWPLNAFLSNLGPTHINFWYVIATEVVYFMCLCFCVSVFLRKWGFFGLYVGGGCRGWQG